MAKRVPSVSSRSPSRVQRNARSAAASAVVERAVERKRKIVAPPLTARRNARGAKVQAKAMISESLSAESRGKAISAGAGQAKTTDQPAEQAAEQPAGQQASGTEQQGQRAVQTHTCVADAVSVSVPIQVAAAVTFGSTLIAQVAERSRSCAAQEVPQPGNIGPEAQEPGRVFGDPSRPRWAGDGGETESGKGARQKGLGSSGGGGNELRRRKRQQQRQRQRQQEQRSQTSSRWWRRGFAPKTCGRRSRRCC